MNHAIQESISDGDRQSGRAVSQVQSQVQERLTADDAVLEALAKLAPKTIPGASSPLVSEDSVNRWSSTLVSLRAAETRARIDASYHDAVQDLAQSSSRRKPNGTHAPPLRKAEVEAELATLRDEIRSVIELVVASEFKTPLGRAMKSARYYRQTNQLEWLHYVLTTLEHLAQQVELMNNHAGTLRSYNQALAEIRSAYAAVNAPPAAAAAAGQTAETRTPVSATNPMFRPRHERTNTNTSSPTVNLIPQVLQRFGIPPSHFSPITALSAVSSQATQRLIAQHGIAGKTTAELLSRSQDERSRDLQALLGSLQANSNFASIRLSDRSLTTKIDKLDRDIAELANAMSSADKGDGEQLRKVTEALREKLAVN
jgi:hypothetical protein